MIIVTRYVLEEMEKMDSDDTSPTRKLYLDLLFKSSEFDTLSDSRFLAPLECAPDITPIDSLLRARERVAEGEKRGAENMKHGSLQANSNRP